MVIPTAPELSSGTVDATIRGPCDAKIIWARGKNPHIAPLECGKNSP